ncbi:MAG: hypothetical protein GY801_50720 [bacterium]|nr:hypothetical protein [bacterium]
MYIVGFLKSKASEEKTKGTISSPVQCRDGEDICLAVENLCLAVDYGIDNFEPELWDALRDTAYFDSNYASIDLHGSPLLLAIIVGKEDVLRGKFIIDN